MKRGDYTNAVQKNMNFQFVFSEIPKSANIS